MILDYMKDEALKGLEITKEYRKVERPKPDWNAIPEGLESIE